MPDVPASVQALALKLDDRATDAQGLLAARPTSSPASPGKAGRYYFATDEGVVYRDNGTGWTALNRIPDASILEAHLAQSLLDLFIPVGTQLVYGGSVLPSGGRFLWADGSLVRQEDYPIAYNLMGHTYNGGVAPAVDGAGKPRFKLPDKRGRTAVGADNFGQGAASVLSAATPRARGNRSGLDRVSLALTEMPAHGHNVRDTGHGHAMNYNGLGNWLGDDQGAVTPYGSVTSGGPAVYRASKPTVASGTANIAQDSVGGSQSHQNMQPYEVDTWIVRVK